MKPSPRTRRLEADLRAIRQLAAESTIFDYQSHGPLPETYRFSFRGPGTWKTERRTVAIRDYHEIVIELGAAYPRLMPNLNWQTPVFHPNVSSSGIVCLGGYGTNWVPSLRLDELCVMLWDMIRYENFDIQSPYNREAALWARDQGDFLLPLDQRPLRDRVANDPSARGLDASPEKLRQPPVVAGISPAANVDQNRYATPGSHGQSNGSGHPAAAGETHAEIEIVDAIPVTTQDEIRFLD